ncbi:ABC-type dipeptide transport system [Striga asiatica]|uniref:ABC-type dipeptide transport system n=1 Tax=Striga asiatica TaxID=4170 RepID=A0A5A7PVJ3_STRAF|nr:ABC-type dipeptide transport system [Striga asiatica]
MANLSDGKKLRERRWVDEGEMGSVKTTLKSRKTCDARVIPRSDGGMLRFIIMQGDRYMIVYRKAIWFKLTRRTILTSLVSNRKKALRRLSRRNPTAEPEGKWSHKILNKVLPFAIVVLEEIVQLRHGCYQPDRYPMLSHPKQEPNSVKDVVRSSELDLQKVHLTWKEANDIKKLCEKNPDPRLFIFLPLSPSSEFVTMVENKLSISEISSSRTLQKKKQPLQVFVPRPTNCPEQLLLASTSDKWARLSKVELAEVEQLVGS